MHAYPSFGRLSVRRSSARRIPGRAVRVEAALIRPRAAFDLPVLPAHFRRYTIRSGELLSLTLSDPLTRGRVGFRRPAQSTVPATSDTQDARTTPLRRLLAPGDLRARAEEFDRRDTPR
jgi:hypothetical protein